MIVGGGDEALRKGRLFLAAGADLSIIAEAVDPEIATEFEGKARLIELAPAPFDFADAVIVVVADQDELTSARYAKWARAAGALVNVVDQPALCDFTTPSIIDRGQVTVAIGTGGAAPVLGQQLREKIEALLPARIGAFAAFAKGFRRDVKVAVPSSQRRLFWQRVFNGPIAEKFLAGDEHAARAAIQGIINNPEADQKSGVVHIVGAGPGDPELLTLRALRLIQEADVILYDKLVSDEILSLVRRDADRVFVGKTKAKHAVPQAEIEKKLVAYAREGKVVVRLKGGDPFVFGRGGEELDALRAAGIPAYVTPGVTAATGCAAAVGMALTHRDFAQAVTFVTGHAKGDVDPDLNWPALATLKHTLVVYMGVTKAASIADNLIVHGRRKETPIAIIENGSRANQRVIKGALNQLGALVDTHSIIGPAVLVIGDVALLADDAICEAAHQPERLSA